MPAKQLESMSEAAAKMTPTASASLDAHRMLRNLEREASGSEQGTAEVSLESLALLLGFVEELSSSVAHPAAVAAAQRLRLATMMASEPQLASHLEAQFSSPPAATSRSSTPRNRQGANPTPLPIAPTSEASAVKAVHTAQRAEKAAIEAAEAAESAAVPVGTDAGGSADMDSITGTIVSAPAATRGGAAAATASKLRALSPITDAPPATAGAARVTAFAAAAAFAPVSGALINHARSVLAAAPIAQQLLASVHSARAIITHGDAVAAGSTALASSPAAASAPAAFPPLAASAPWDLPRSVPRSLFNGGMGAQGSSSAVVALLLELGSWEFDIFALAALRPHTVIQTVAWACLLRHNLPRALGLAEPVVRRWLEAVEEGYTDPPYHNRVHGADVTQTTFWFTWHGRAVTAATKDAAGVASLTSPPARCTAGGGMGSWLTPEECLAMVLGAAAHDTGHFGRNNPYLVATQHPLALRYNDRSPLESMHAARSFELMQDPGMDWLSALPAPQRKGVRRDMLSIILATDNAEHFAQLGRLHAMLEAARTARAIAAPSPAEPGATTASDAVDGAAAASALPVFDLDANDEARTLIKGLALHAADVSNPAKSFSTAAVWADRVRREFYEQGDEERAQGLSIAPGFDRFSEIPMGKFQLGFIRAIVQPLYRALQSTNCNDLVDADTVAPWFTLTTPLGHLDSNIVRWEGRLAAEAAAAAAMAAKSDTAAAVKANSVIPPPPPAGPLG